MKLVLLKTDKKYLLYRCNAKDKKILVSIDKKCVKKRKTDLKDTLYTKNLLCYNKVHHIIKFEV